MSLFASSLSGFGGDIWTNNGFSFASQLNEILDKESFTLAELLEEDEVLQEVKSLNDKLISFLCQPETLLELVGYIISTPDSDAGDNRTFKYPYMSCEIFCCEVPEILNAITAGADHGAAWMHKLFSLVYLEGDVDVRAAGYFEKVVSLLLKHKCAHLCTFINGEGMPLFERFLVHLGNFSTMQVAKRLLLPKFASLQEVETPTWNMFSETSVEGADTGGEEDGEEELSSWCSWGEDRNVLMALVAALSGGTSRSEKSGDVLYASHTAELLLKLIGQSSAESAFLTSMFSDEVTRILVGAAATVEHMAGDEGDDLVLGTTKEDTTIGAFQILGAMLGRLSPQDQPLTGGSDLLDQGADAVLSAVPNVDNDLFVRHLSGLVPSICTSLRRRLQTNDTFPAQIREQAPRMGKLCLQGVQFIESLIRLDHAVMDAALKKEEALDLCLSLVPKFRAATLLHQSVCAMLTMVLEDASRGLLQEHLLTDCKLVQRLLELVDSSQAAKRAADEGDRQSRRMGYMGHVLLICQAVLTAQEASSSSSSSSSEDAVEKEGDGEGERVAAPATATSSSLVKRLIDEGDCVERWQAFCIGALAEMTALQSNPLGGFPIPSRDGEPAGDLEEDGGGSWGSSFPDFDQQQLQQQLHEDSAVDELPGGNLSAQQDLFGMPAEEDLFATSTPGNQLDFAEFANFSAPPPPPPADEAPQPNDAAAD